MKLGEWVDRQKLEKYVQDKIITIRKHPNFPLLIANYSHKAASIPQSQWDTTLSRCRGLVYEEGSEDIYAIPFSKFWNYTPGQTLPEGIPTVYEKLDGSLGIGFWYHDKFIIATRGSFESDQANWANKWAGDNLDHSKCSEIAKHYTHLFEIVYPDDKKVVDYDFAGLVLIGCCCRLNGNELPIEDAFLLEKPWLKNVRLPRRLEYRDLVSLQSRDIKNEEGYVCQWEPLLESWYRVKLKFDTYKSLHRTYFSTSTESVWECLKSGTEIDLGSADENLKKWVDKLVDNLCYNRSILKQQAEKAFREAIEYVNYQYGLEDSEKDRRKAFAFKAMQFNYPKLLFSLYDARFDVFDQQVWDLVRPHPIERFRKLEDE